MLQQLKKNDGNYRGLSAAAKSSWHRLLQYNRLDREGLHHVYERATRESRLEQAYLDTTFRVNVFGEEVDVRPGRRLRDLEKALSIWSPSRWAIITAYNPQSRVLSDVENTERDIALRRRIDREKLMSFPVLGIGDVGDGTPELSLLVLRSAAARRSRLAESSGRRRLSWANAASAPNWCGATRSKRGHDHTLDQNRRITMPYLE